jgi:hypothetical protein
MSTTTVRSTETAPGWPSGSVWVSLLLSGWTFIRSLDDDADRDRVEERLVCLELFGVNDCGSK